MEEVVEHIDDPVVPQRHLLLLALGMLHDRDEVPGDGLALRADRGVEPELGQLLRAGPDGDQGEVELLVGQEEGRGIEREGLGWSGWPSTPSSKLNSISLAAAVSASGSTWWLVSSRREVTRDPVPKPITRPA